MIGTRGGLGRIVAMVIGLAVVLMLALASEARAGVYQVAQCGWGVGAELDQVLPATEGAAFSLDPGGCLAPIGSGPVGMGFEGAIAPDGIRGLARARWVAPPGTSFTAAHVTWFGNPQPGNWQGLGVDVDGRFHILASAFTNTIPTRLDLPIEGRAWGFEAWLQCLMDGPVVGCTRSVASTMRLRDLVFVLDDPVVPAAQLGGALTEAGWHRGAVRLELAAADDGSGVASTVATIDGRPVIATPAACAVKTIEGEVRGIRMQPCPPRATQAVEVDTTRLADGVHSLRGYATDFAGGQGWAPDGQIKIDNSPPALSFANPADGRVEVAVKDRYSGPAAGTISVRAADTDAWTDLGASFEDDDDGTATLVAQLPDLGDRAYVLRAVATDAAGNAGFAQQRFSAAPGARRKAGDGHGRGKAPGTAPPSATHGRPSRLTARLGSAGSDLTIDYGDSARVRGRVTDSHGAGVARRLVEVVARAAAAIGRPPERRRVLTDRSGHFDLRLPPGTSRRVIVAFQGGGGLDPAPRRSLALHVRAAVSLAAKPLSLRTGETVALTGRVTPGAARIPKRGKVVTIQYLERASGRWRPALVVRTDPRGRFAAHYRFRYVTGDARIRLRATALPEAGWPYAEGSSPSLAIEVRG